MGTRPFLSIALLIRSTASAAIPIIFLILEGRAVAAALFTRCNHVQSDRLGLFRAHGIGRIQLLLESIEDHGAAFTSEFRGIKICSGHLLPIIQEIMANLVYSVGDNVYSAWEDSHS